MNRLGQAQTPTGGFNRRWVPDFGRDFDNMAQSVFVLNI